MITNHGTGRTTTAPSRRLLRRLVAVSVLAAVVSSVAVAVEPEVAGAQPTDPAWDSLIAVGDLAECANIDNVEKVAEAIGRTTGPIAALGDVVYPSGTKEDFEECFDPIFGEHRDRFRPAPGNHEYRTDGAGPFYDYFGANAGAEGEGWFAYDVGTWRVIALNSNCSEVGGCDRNSPQYRWLERELAANTEVCRIAYWHHPRFTSSSNHGEARKMGDIVTLLHREETEAVLAGHVHHYERFSRLDPEGRPDPDGIRFFNVGTGGAFPRGFERIAEGSEARRSGVYGVLRLTLTDAEMRWSFRAEGGEFRDSGRQQCQALPPLVGDEDVAALYRAAFGRRPDQPGLTYWTDRRAEGLGLDEIATLFAASPEFTQRFGAPTDGEFVDLVYRNVLLRDPDEPGRRYWLGVVSDQPRSALLLYFSLSVEFRSG